MNAQHRLVAVDGLRGIAVAAVFLVHSLPEFPGGFLGVDLFFVISGFVITRLLLRDRPVFRTFYRNRFLRIVPPAVPVLTLAAVLAATGYRWVAWPEIAYAGLGVMNWVRVSGAVDTSILAHFWSLSIEEQFYLFWPALLFILARSRPDRLFPVIAGLAVLAIVWQLFAALPDPARHRVYNGTDTRICQLLVGCALAVKPAAWRTPAWLALGCATLLAAAVLTVPVVSPKYLTFGIPLAALLCALVVDFAAYDQSLFTAPLRWAPLQWAGARSYALYLWHLPMLRLAIDLGEWTGLRAIWFLLGALAATCAMAELSWRLIERPAARLRHRGLAAEQQSTVQR